MTSASRTPARSELPERPAHLWLIALSPTIWALHFLACYATAAIWCAKAEPAAAPLGPARIAVTAYTLVALAAIAAVGWHAWRRRALADAGPVDEGDPRHDGVPPEAGSARAGSPHHAGSSHDAGSSPDAGRPHDADTPGDRERFLALATLLLSGLSFVATVFTALAAVFIGDCR